MIMVSQRAKDEYMWLESFIQSIKKITKIFFIKKIIELNDNETFYI